MAVDAVAATDTPSQPYRLARNPKYEGQRSYTFEETLAMFDFWDVVDIFNPLQHIPIIGSIYRELTGDEIGSFATVAGGALFGGPIGAVFGVANAVVKEATGSDPGQLAMAAFLSDDGTRPATMAPLPDNVANAAPSAPLGATLLAARGGVQADATTVATSPVTVFTGVTNPGGTGGALASGTVSSAWANPYAAPLGGLLLSGQGDRLMPGAVFDGGAQARTLTRADAVPTLTGAQSAALAAFVTQQSGGGPSRGDGSPRITTAPGGITGAELAARTAVAPAAATDPGHQGQDMPQNETPTMTQGQDQDASRNPRQDRAPDDPSTRQPAAMAAPAVPTDIQRGRDALRTRLAAAQGASLPGLGPNQGLGAAAGAATEVAAADGRPTGMTLADYRDRPVTPAVDADRRPSGRGRAGSRTAINGGDAAGFANLLPDPATMARVLEQGGTVANAVAAQARRAAEGLGHTVSPAPVTGGYPRPEAFRAMPVAGNGEATATTTPAVPTPVAAGDGSAPVVAQPWFSNQVMDAMRRYDALRDGAGAIQPVS
ncbi:hypothetical protein [Roseospira visakhapatnamensis]|uniref:Uncharacterized protein n=1 Tax=Roseospira visakhapatnamensis TaxID=390880 RepID=A0A7W6RGT0_9PROT|nr:hypothetical protein [Roseospira visakhapatnamensis]MBB4268047.1 hypothetical protein [Roseospira visakhapatnamensis]